MRITARAARTRKLPWHELTLILQEKHEELRSLQAACDVVKDQCRKLEQAIEVMQQPQLKPPVNVVHGSRYDLSRLPLLSNNHERLRCLAEMNNGVVNVTKATEALIESGVTRAKKNNLRPNIHNLLMDDPCWEKVGPGNFKYLGDSDICHNVAGRLSAAFALA